jgi:hypothetical protein
MNSIVVAETSSTVVVTEDGSTVIVQTPVLQIALGGSTGQLLIKASNTDLDTTWTSTLDGGTY